MLAGKIQLKVVHALYQTGLYVVQRSLLQCLSIQLQDYSLFDQQASKRIYHAA